MREIGIGDRDETIADDAPDAWSAYLEPGESLLWTGAPETGLKFRSIDWVIVPFSLLWTAMAIAWEAAVIASGAPLIFAIWGVPFVLMGFYIAVGRFFWDAHARARTRYALTDRRAIVASAAWRRRMTSLSLAPDLPIELEGDAGTLRFGAPPEIDWDSDEGSGERQPGAQRRRMRRRPGLRLAFEFLGPEGETVLGLARRAAALARPAGQA